MTDVPGFNDRRRQHAELFTSAFSDLPGIDTPYTAPYAHHVFHQYTIRCDRRDQLRSHLAQKGISTGVYYPELLYHAPAIQAFAGNPQPQSEQATKEVLSLPVHPYLLEGELDHIVESVKAFPW